MKTRLLMVLIAILIASSDRALAGSSSAVSPAITVNTRDGDRPMVQEVKSAYCSGIQRVYFLNGVPLNVSFTATFDWNGKPPGTVQFITPSGTQTQIASGRQATQSYDVGSAFGVGGTLTVKAVAADGTESWLYPVKFDVINPPPDVPASGLYVKPWTVGLVYSTEVPSLQLFSVQSAPVSSDVPWFGGKQFTFAPEVSGEITIKGDGTAEETFKLAVDAEGEVKKGVNLAGVPIGSVGGSGGFAGRTDLAYSAGTGWYVTSGSFGIEFSGQVESPDIQLGTSPFYVNFGLATDSQLVLTVKAVGASSRTYEGTWEGDAQAMGAIGFGVSWLGGVEAWARGGPFWTIDFWPTVDLTDIGVQLELGWRAKALGGHFEYEQGLLDYTWPQQAAALQAWQRTFFRQLNKPDASQWKLSPRDYLKQPYAVFTSGSTKRLLALGIEAELGATVSSIETNVFPYSEPSLSVNSTNRMLLWIWDDPARDATNRTEVIWSTWTGSGWSNPTSVWNDATADFSPVVRLFADGSALAVWENEHSVLPGGSTLNDALAGLEIAAAQFNPITGLWLPTNLTDNAYLDRTPQLAAGSNGKALLTWISNPSNSPFGATNALNIVQSRLWDGSGWVDARNIATDVPMLLWSTVAFDGTNGVFLAAVDGDDDQSTVDDQELWGATFDGVAWSAFTRLTTNAVQDTKPQAVYDSAGTLLVAWYQGSNIVVHAGDLNLGSPMVAGTLSGTSSQKDFKLVTGPAGQVSMVWEDLAADGTGPDPFLLNWDPTLGVWSQPLRLLNSTNELERSFSAAYADDGALLMAYNRVAVALDTNNVPQFGQADLMFMDYLIGSDLAVNSGDIALSVPNPAPGQSVDISAVVHNIGELAATNVAVEFYDGDPGDSGVQIGSSQIVPDILPAGSNATVQVTWTVPSTTSNRTIYVVVDRALEQEDRNRANNTATKTVLAPDLTISDMTVLQPSVTDRIINARCTNLGTIPTVSPVEVVFHEDSPTGTVLATVPISALPTNGVYDASFEWNLSGLTFTSAFVLVYATVDEANTVSEADKDNNTRMVAVTTTALPQPPAGMAASALAYNQVSLTWSDSFQNATGFTIERSVNGGAFVLFATAAGNATNLTDGTVGCGSSYLYRIVATNSFGVSDYSYVAALLPVAADSDADGMPDCWTLQYFGHPTGQATDQSRALDDADGDSQNNLAEFLAGTDPTNSSSAFRITDVGIEGEDVRVTWTMGSDRTNALQVAAGDVNGGFTDNFFDIFTVTNTVGSVTNYLDLGATTNFPVRYYRARLVP